MTRRRLDYDRTAVRTLRPDPEGGGPGKADARARAIELGRKLRARQIRKERLGVEAVRVVFEVSGRKWPFPDGADLEVLEQPPSVGAALAASQRGKPRPPTMMVVRERT